MPLWSGVTVSPADVLPALIIFAMSYPRMTQLDVVGTVTTTSEAIAVLATFCWMSTK
jgi:hypothetical protein